MGRDRDHYFPVETVRAMGDLGLFALPFPEPYGAGGDLTALCIAIEEIAWSDQSLAITLEAGVGLGANPIARFGTEAQKERWLPDLCAGRTLGAFGLTEPDAGSDAGGTRTTAVFDEDTAEWVIDGEKAFITNSGTPITSIVTVTARTGSNEILDDHRPERYAWGSRSSPPTAKWGGTPRIPTGCASRAAGCPRTTCSGSPAEGWRSSSASSTRDGSPSGRSRWA